MSSNGELVSAAAGQQIELLPDLDLVEKIKSEALIKGGFSASDDEGDERADYSQLQFACLQVMLERHIVHGKRDLGPTAVTQFELYQELLPDGPGAQALAETVEEDLARKALIKLLWGYTNVGHTGFVQKHCAGDGLVLCEADVSRTKLNLETNKRQPGTERGRFLTRDGELIMTYFTGPAGAAFIKAARKLEAQLGLVHERRPELAVPVAKQLNAVVKQAVTAIPHADPRQVNALNAGDDTES